MSRIQSHAADGFDPWVASNEAAGVAPLIIDERKVTKKAKRFITNGSYLNPEPIAHSVNFDLTEPTPRSPRGLPNSMRSNYIAAKSGP
jgi:hypothetical protein